ncbi:MAG: alginate lyase family protein, partial [Pseudomonadota bacterium]
SFFDLHDQQLGNPIDWHRDFNQNIPSPKTLSGKIDYRDARVAGDCKLVWDPNRHHQWLTLAQAHAISGDDSYVDALCDQMKSWLDENPYGYGMNWRSPLELGIRMINWVWALDLVRESGRIDEPLWQRLKRSLYLHAWDVSRKFSQGSSANNHLIGEAAGVYVVACYFNNCEESAIWRAASRDILITEIERQSYSDGANREQTFSYQLFVQQFFLLCGKVADWSDSPMPAGYWSSLRTSVDFSTAMTQACSALPMIGDADDGYVYKLDWQETRLAEHQALMASKDKSQELAAQIRGTPASVAWLGADAETFQTLSDLRAAAPAPVLSSKRFDDSGYYLLQHQNDSGQTISALLDAGELGYGAIAAHGHADALSILLRVDGKEILVDPGTYDYFTYPAWRNHFRSTRAHNTVEIDGADQSRMLGPFLWTDAATAHLLEFSDDSDYAVAIAEHDGYKRLVDPVAHQRELRLHKADGSLRIVDRLNATAHHEAAIAYQFSEDCEVQSTDMNNQFFVSNGSLKLLLTLDPKCDVELFKGSDNPGPGWVSRGYHRKEPAWYLRAKAMFSGSTEISAIFERL